MVYIQRDQIHGVHTERSDTWCTYREIRYMVYIQRDQIHGVHTERSDTWCTYREIRYMVYIQRDQIHDRLQYGKSQAIKIWGLERLGTRLHVYYLKHNCCTHGTDEGLHG